MLFIWMYPCRTNSCKSGLDRDGPNPSCFIPTWHECLSTTFLKVGLPKPQQKHRGSTSPSVKSRNPKVQHPPNVPRAHLPGAQSIEQEFRGEAFLSKLSYWDYHFGASPSKSFTVTIASKAWHIKNKHIMMFVVGVGMFQVIAIAPPWKWYMNSISTCKMPWLTPSLEKSNVVSHIGNLTKWI